MKNVILSLTVLLLISACSGNDPRNPGVEPAGVLLKNQIIETAEGSRQYHLFLPVSPISAQIVFLFHGHGGSSDQILGLERTVAPYKVWLDIAERENLLLVVPNGSLGSRGTRGWNDCRVDVETNPDSDDVEFFNVLLNDIRSRYGTENSSVYAVGTSNGGTMVQRLADEMPEVLDAVAVLVTSRPINSDCTESVLPLSILFMNGTSDPLVPYEGGQIASNRGEVLSTNETINHWVRRNQTATIPAEMAIENIDQTDNSNIVRRSYTNGAEQSVVEHYEVINGGHTEPSIKEKYGPIYKLIVGNQNHDLEFAEEVWKFLKQNRKN